MPELQEQLYCSQQIIIPPKFPYVLKKFAKAAIKTQPYDLLRWAMEYFVALAEDRIPPVKSRLEYPIFNTEGGLSRGYLKILVKQLDGCTELSVSTVENRWKGSCLELEELRRILCLCDALFLDEVDPLRFFAVAAGMLTKSLTQTMLLICELLTNEPDGGSATVPVSKFLDMYTFLARIDASADTKYINGVREGLGDGADKTLSVNTSDDYVTSDEVVVETAPESIGEEGHDEQQKDAKMRQALGGSDSQASGDEIRGDESASGTTGRKCVITGRQMSATSGEFVVNTIEQEIWTNVEQQIALLPDPSTVKRKATPEQVQAVRDIVEDYMREALEVVIPEQAEEEEIAEEEPDIVMVYAIPGIGPIVIESIIEEFTKYAREVASRQAECIMPRNLRHFLCPPLEEYSEQRFDSPINKY